MNLKLSTSWSAILTTFKLISIVSHSRVGINPTALNRISEISSNNQGVVASGWVIVFTAIMAPATVPQGMLQMGPINFKCNF